MSLFRDDGIVLRTQKLGEADRIITLLTRGHGRVRAVARGVRRTKSKFGARLEPGMIECRLLIIWQPLHTPSANASSRAKKAENSARARSLKRMLLAQPSPAPSTSP